MKQVAYFLLLLTSWAQVDDLLLPLVSVSQSASLPSDDDEFLLCERQELQARLTPREEPQSFGVKPNSADIASLRRSVPSEWKPAARFACPSSYVFMSLQI
jgi:hypothetical protein